MVVVYNFMFAIFKLVSITDFTNCFPSALILFTQQHTLIMCICNWQVQGQLTVLSDPVYCLWSPSHMCVSIHSHTGHYWLSHIFAVLILPFSVAIEVLMKFIRCSHTIKGGRMLEYLLCMLRWAAQHKLNSCRLSNSSRNRGAGMVAWSMQNYD